MKTEPSKKEIESTSRGSPYMDNIMAQAYGMRSGGYERAKESLYEIFPELKIKARRQKRVNRPRPKPDFK